LGTPPGIPLLDSSSFSPRSPSQYTSHEPMGVGATLSLWMVQAEKPGRTVNNQRPIMILGFILNLCQLFPNIVDL